MVLIPAANQPCPCGSGRDFTACCGPLLDGSGSARTAEQLMRSRYTANVLADFEYLSRSWHELTRPEQMAEGQPISWRNLQVIRSVEEKEGERKAQVEFRAWYLQGHYLQVHHEVSRFVYEQERWLYLDGRIIIHEPAVDLRQVGRNDPCPCGSGRKFKKCCLGR